MIAQSYIKANLRSLDRMYVAARSQKEALFYSKLAILELCGWIEESMDDVILRCARRCLRRDENFKYVSKQIVDRTYGFEYEKNFRRMLIQLLGIVTVERIENGIDDAKLASMKGTLSNLKVARNTEAHTHIKGVTRKINAPSVTLSQFAPVFQGLLEYQKAVRNYRM